MGVRSGAPWSTFVGSRRLVSHAVARCIVQSFWTAAKAPSLKDAMGFTSTHQNLL
jgi:hypothetical protein